MYNKRYYELNKEMCNNYKKKYYLKHREKYIKMAKQYAIDHKDEINEQRNQIIECICGLTYKQCRRTRHIQSKKHKIREVQAVFDGLQSIFKEVRDGIEFVKNL